MSSERDHALLDLGATAIAAGASIPEISIGAADAPRGGAGPEASKARLRNETNSLARAARAGRALAAYLVAGLVGWGLYDLAASVRPSWPDVFGAGSAQKSAEQAELLRLTQKMAADIRALQARLEAVEKARGPDANALSSDEANRRIGEAKAGVDARIGGLENEIEALRHEAASRRAEAQAVSDQPERRAGEAVGHAHRGAVVTAHVQAGWKRARPRGDAFDPALHPGAPGAPRPLGAALYR